ncbi:MAG: DUF72 domain-containing protein [Nitrososphaeraceae archaeon]
MQYHIGRLRLSYSAWQGLFYAHNLENRILALLIQLPPSMGRVEGMNRLRDIIPELDKSFRYVVEVRDSS